ncbi:MAG: diphosphomevalonate decarboxylase [Candidatus Marivariicella framensis]|jgi:diphosphomevalonate decarboxylase|tara:strand:+ start:9315 stop:10385 length:1071 start_codon:yes stop_codon:yes gene_type:complete
MVEQDFIFKKVKLVNGFSSWESPSNIALIKYWGKYGEQLPENPSISFTLSECKTITKIYYRPKKEKEIDNFSFLFDGSLKPSFNNKINQFINRISIYIPAIKHHFFEIESHNTFPHSSGIASSASAMSSLALCFMEIEKQINTKISKLDFIKKASFLARLGSGSATRSIEGPIVYWGNSKAYDDSSLLYGTPLNNIASVFTTYQDTILIIDKNEKRVSSTLGHQLMKSNPYAKNRFIQANENMNQLKDVLIKGDLDNFIKIIELEALSLHAMMMTSSPSFILMQPNTLFVINEVYEFRKRTAIPICFTLDAGANIHLLYPHRFFKKVQNFIKEKVLKYCVSKQFINDHVGVGSKKI